MLDALTGRVESISLWPLAQSEIKGTAGNFDTGLLLHLLGADEERLASDDQITGKALENFVAMEILRHAEWSEKAPKLFHYRRSRDEIDVVLEDRAGNIAAVEVKASASLRASAWRALERLRREGQRLSLRRPALHRRGHRAAGRPNLRGADQRPVVDHEAAARQPSAIGAE